MSESVLEQIIRTHAGRSMDEPRPPRNANLTSRETIEIANEIVSLRSRLEQQVTEIARLREALRWYEERVRDCRKIHSEGERARWELDSDGGARAREALSTSAEGGGGASTDDNPRVAAQEAPEYISRQLELLRKALQRGDDFSVSGASIALGWAIGHLRGQNWYQQPTDNEEEKS